jgi:hypothetical protein
MKKLFLLILVCFLGLTSCEEILFEHDFSSKNPETNFNYLWNQCNEKYSYFELKDLDWDSVYSTYESLVYPEMTDDSLFSVLKLMLGELKDGHVNLFSNFNTSFNYVIYSGSDNYDRRIVFDNYISSNEYITGPFRHDFLENKELGYIRFDQFSGEVTEADLDFVLSRYADTKGIIFDIRENPGGSPADLFKILSRFVDEELLIYYTRIKKPGISHDDFTGLMPVYLKPSSGKRFLKNIVVLVDRGTYSAGSFFALATKSIPNIVLIGDTTGGGLGAPNGGQLPNGWTYRFSITQTLSIDKNETYENGVPPDIHAAYNWSDRSKDEIIERAKEELL